MNQEIRNRCYKMHLDGHTQKEIASKLNLSQSKVSRTISSMKGNDFRLALKVMEGQSSAGYNVANHSQKRQAKRVTLSATNPDKTDSSKLLTRQIAIANTQAEIIKRRIKRAKLELVNEKRRRLERMFGMNTG